MDLMENKCTVDFVYCLGKASEVPFVGFVTGPLFAIAGIAQLALNLVGIVFVLLPSICLSKDNPLHVSHFCHYAGSGGGYILFGIFAFLPFTSLIIKD